MSRLLRRSRRGGGKDDNESVSSKDNEEDGGGRPVSSRNGIGLGSETTTAPDGGGGDVLSWISDQQRSVDQTSALANGIVNDQKKKTSGSGVIKLDRKVVETLQNEITLSIKKLQDLAIVLKNAVENEDNENEEQAQPTAVVVAEEVDEGAESDDTVVAPVLRKGQLPKKKEEGNANVTSSVSANPTPEKKEKQKHASSENDSDADTSSTPKKELRSRRPIKKERVEVEAPPSPADQLLEAAIDNNQVEEDDAGANSDDTMIPPVRRSSPTEAKENENSVASSVVAQPEEGVPLEEDSVINPKIELLQQQGLLDDDNDEDMAEPLDSSAADILENSIDVPMEEEEDEGAKSDDTCIPPVVRKPSPKKKDDENVAAPSAEAEQASSSKKGSWTSLSLKQESQSKRQRNKDSETIDELLGSPSADHSKKTVEEAVEQAEAESSDNTATPKTQVVKKSPAKIKQEKIANVKSTATVNGKENASSGNESDNTLSREFERLAEADSMEAETSNTTTAEKPSDSASANQSNITLDEPMQDADADGDSDETVLTPIIKRNPKTEKVEDSTPKKNPKIEKVEDSTPKKNPKIEKVEDAVPKKNPSKEKEEASINATTSATPDEGKGASSGGDSDNTSKRNLRRKIVEEKKAMEELLGSSDSDEASSITTRASRRRTKKQTPEKKQRKKSEEGNESSSSSRKVGSSTDAGKKKNVSPKDDPKLKDGAAYVKIEKLNQKILNKLEEQNFIVLNGYTKMKKNSKRGKLMDSDSDSDSYDTDDTIKKLRMEVKKLSRTSILTTVAYKKKTKKADDAGPKDKKRGKGGRKKKNEDDHRDELLSSDEESDGLLSSSRGAPLIRGQNKELMDDSDSKEDIDASDSDVARNKKKTRSQAKGQQIKKEKDSDKKRKTYKSLNIRGSDSDDKACERDLLGSDSDDSDTEKKKRKKKADSDSDGKTKVLTRKARAKVVRESDSDSDVKSSKKKEKEVVTLDSDDSDQTIKKGKDDSSDSDSDFIQKKSKIKDRKRKKADSDSSIQSIHSDSSNDSDSDFKKKPTKGKRRRKDSDSDTKTKKKRRRVVVNDSDDSDKKSDSDIQEIEPGENDGSPHKGRKNIRKIMSSKHIAKSTKEAEREEEDRMKRLSEKQKLFNGIHKAPETDQVERLVLDVDPETKEPVIEVEEAICKKLKPHQAEGIKFMYNACFESVAMIKENKVPGGCILAHCMGLGKTLQSIAFVHALLTNSEVSGIKTALVICPLSTVTNWFNEFKKWTEDATDIRLHQLYDAKRTNADRASYLRKWMNKGGVGIIHYDMFVRLADPKKKQKMKERLRQEIEECLLDPGPDLVICDEGHLLKNCKSQRALAVNQLRTRRRVVLTGTPLQNNLIEYHTMMNFVKPNLLGSLVEFTNRFVNPIQNGQHADSTEHDVKTMKRRAHVLHGKLEGCVQRCDYSILAPYLPPKYEYIINIKLSKKQEEVYKYYLDHVINETDYAEKRKNLLKYYSELVKVWSHPIALTMKKNKKDDDDETEEDDNSLKDFICDDEDSDVVSVNSEAGSNSSNSNPSKSKGERRTRSKGLDPDAPKDLSDAPASFGNNWWNAIFKSKDEMYDVSLSGKLVILQEILKTCETIGDRVLVFSQFLTSLDIIEEFLADWDKEAQEKLKDDKKVMTFPFTETGNEGRWRKNIEYFRIDGGVKQSDRQKDCDKFNRKSTLSRAKLFLISTKAGGLGINLYGANRVVIFDASWNPSQDMQSIFRVYRFGQDKPCYIYRLIAYGTMEQKILRRQITKLSLSSRVVDEHQIQRHFKFDDVNELYKYDEDESGSSTSVMAVPKDKLLADLILSMSEWIKSYEEFDSLLENRPDEGLSKEEKELAWAEYKIVSQRQRQQGFNGMTQEMEVQTYMKVRGRIEIGYPGASETQIETATQQSLQAIQKIRSLMLLQNGLPPDRCHEIDPVINPLKKWLQDSVNEKVKPAADTISDLLPPLPKEFYMNPAPQNVMRPMMGVRPPMPRSRYSAPRSQSQFTPQNIRQISHSFANAINQMPSMNAQSFMQQQIRQQLMQQQLQRNMNNMNMMNGSMNMNRDPLQ